MPTRCVCPPAGTRIGGRKRSKRATILSKMDKNTKVNVQAGYQWMVGAIDGIAVERRLEKIAKVRVWPRIGEAVMVGSSPHGVWQAIRIFFRGGEPDYEYTNYGARDDALFYGAPINDDMRNDDREREAMAAEGERLANPTGLASARKQRATS